MWDRMSWENAQVGPESDYYDSHVENTNQKKQKIGPVIPKHNLDVKFGNVYRSINNIFFLNNTLLNLDFEPLYT